MTILRKLGKNVPENIRIEFDEFVKQMETKNNELIEKKLANEKEKENKKNEVINMAKKEYSDATDGPNKEYLVITNSIDQEYQNVVLQARAARDDKIARTKKVLDGKTISHKEKYEKIVFDENKKFEEYKLKSTEDYNIKRKEVKKQFQDTLETLKKKYPNIDALRIVRIS